MKYRNIVLLSTSLLLFGTVTPTALPIIGGENVQAQEKGYLEAGKAYVEYGVLNQDLVSSDGEVYPAGTKVARASRQDGIATGVYYLNLNVGAFFSTGAGKIPAQYVTKVSSEIFQAGATGKNVANNPVSPGAKDSPLQPYTPTPAQVDKTELNKVIAQAEQAINADIYTDSSVANLKTALNSAYGVRDNSNASQQDVDNTTSTLQTAISALQKKPVTTNKQELQNTINQSKAAIENPNGYTSETFNPFKQVYDAAVTVLNNPNALQYDIDDAEGALSYRLNKLKKVSTPTVNKSQLQSAIKNAESKLADFGNYADNSVSALSTALNNAISINENSNATQNDIDSTLSALNLAVDKLQLKQQPAEVNKKALNQAVGDATSVLKDDSHYTEESVKAVKTALTKAEKIQNDQNATQDQIDEVTKTLNQAISELQQKDIVSKSALQFAIDDANKALQAEERYTQESVNELKIVIEKAELVLNDQNATHDEVNAETISLTKAIKNLELAEKPIEMNKVELKNTLTVANNVLKDESIYTLESVKTVKEAITNAEAVNLDGQSTQEEVDKATISLLKAIDGLTKNTETPVQVDKTALQDALTKANKVTDLSSYTTSSVNVFKSAKTNAETVNLDDQSTQEEINQATTSLLKAIDGLTKHTEIPVQVDKTALQNALTKANKVSKLSQYTTLSVASFKLAKNTAEAVNLTSKATQKEVDQATTNLLNAIEGLKKNNSIDSTTTNNKGSNSLNNITKLSTKPTTSNIVKGNNKTLPKTNEKPVNQLLTLFGGLTATLSSLFVLKRRK
ncbi:hypothetical protein [Vagococcus luciliae]|uniref:Gram-positive cocci surface proteins LPxTG domain-containing protein n=1 Tax=Vagococcus luciliae TaxID=2920380 RepID=A0ABY5P0B1_9ENTE|nr:hypothetical protein [Vagococcus luciliae]UUV99360.1 hypothetical protein G314FT_15210 [Vagococcus luciliae]